MPAYTWKKVKIADGLLSGLRSKPGGSLVVQTGFPTSLADLIVKNHVRMKKSTLKNKKKALPSSDLAAATPGGDGSSFSGNERLSGPSLVENAINADQKVGSGSGFWVVVGKVILLASLVVIRNKMLVLGITISAFALLILELSGFRAWRFLNSCYDRKECLDSVFGVSDFQVREWASPIREIGVQSRTGTSMSDAKWDEWDGFSRKGEDLITKACGSSRKSKAKKLFRKFFPKKLRETGEGGIAHCCIEATEVELTDDKHLLMREEEGDSDTEVLSFKSCCGDLDDGKDAYSTHRTLKVNRLRKFAVLVFFVVVLCGLVKGKVFALLLVLAWCFLFNFIEVVSVRNKSSFR